MSGARQVTSIVDMRGTDQQDPTPCVTADPELWFAERPAELGLAKSICARCPVRAACLAGALERREPWGVWGGEIVEHGVVLAYKRGRGRPSNADRRLGLVTMTADGRRRDRPSHSRARLPREVQPDGVAPDTPDRAFTRPDRAETSRSRSA